MHGFIVALITPTPGYRAKLIVICSGFGLDFKKMFHAYPKDKPSTVKNGVFQNTLGALRSPGY